MSGGDGPPAVYFLSDYGLADEFVGVVHALLHAMAPGIPVVDLGHEVPPFDVAAGAGMLARCAPYLAGGVVMAVVDPGVGTDRRGVAVETAAGGPSWLIGPDNGLLVPLARALGGARRAVVLAPAGGPAGPGRLVAGSGVRAGPTFDGRDLFAPAAAHLVLGRPAAELGTEADPASLESWEPSAPRGRRRDPAPMGGGAGRSDGELETSVTWVDRFGNLQLGTDADDLERIGASGATSFWVTLPGPAQGGEAATSEPVPPIPVRRVRAFDDLGAGELGLITDSTGRLALVLCRASAAGRLAPIGTGDAVRISVRSPPGT